MALKLVIDSLTEAPGNLRDEYKQGDDGKFHLTLEGEPAKLAEAKAKVDTFRENNVNLMRERDQLKAKLDELAASKSDTSKLEADLAAERRAHSATQLTNAVVTKFLAMGGRASACDFIAAEAAKTFSMEDGKLTANEFSPADPASPLSIEEWMQRQMAEKDYVFQPSRGGGAPRGGSTVTRFGERPNQKVLKNPTPQELGANARDIASGKLKVEHS